MSWPGKLFSFAKREPERVAMANLFQAFEEDSGDFEQLDRHLLVVGQSGSGKSYFIGKMVEELAMKTHARVVILDRAGDFLKILLSSDEKNLSGLLAIVHSQWSDREFQEQFGDPFQMFQFHRLAVHPYWFDALDLCAVFGLPYNHAYWGPIGDAQRGLQDQYDFASLVIKLGKVPELPTDINFNGIDFLTERLFSRPSNSDYVRRYGESNQSSSFHDTARRVVENELQEGLRSSGRASSRESGPEMVTRR